MATHSYVLSYIGSDDPARGDSQAVKGLGRAFAEKTGRKWVMLDDETVRALYPDHSADDAYENYFLENGHPAIVLANSRNIGERGFPHSHVICGNNEELSRIYNPDFPSLVSHHLTEASLTEARSRFEVNFPALGKPLIALMHIETGLRHTELAGKIASMLKAEGFGEACVFLCGTRRTPVQAQIDLLKGLRSEAANSGLCIDVQNYLLGPQFNRNEDFNPYAGLIASADHFILSGESKSIISECLFSGKSVMTFNTSYPDLEAQGLAHNLTGYDGEKGFPTRNLKHLNVTDMIVDAMIEKHARSFRRRAPFSQPEDLRPL